MQNLYFIFVLSAVVFLNEVLQGSAVVTRNDRVWPISNSASVDLAQSSPFGPRLQISNNRAYDYHRGVDIPLTLYTNVYAIADGEININGSHHLFSDGVVQIQHTNWEEDPSANFYSTYIHVVMNHSGADTLYFNIGDHVTKGQLIAYSNETASLPHIHFEIRDGNYAKEYACNPWKYLPNSNNDYTSFEAKLSLTPNYNSADCEAIVNVSVPPNQLTFNRVELHILDNSDNPQKVRFYDMCGINLNRSQDQVDNQTYLEDPNDPDSYQIVIYPKHFNSASYSKNENSTHEFDFVDLPQLDGGGGKVMAKIFDVFGNSRSTEYVSYTCTGSGGGGEGTTTSPPPVTRNDRVWPIGNGDSVDLGQSSPYGSRSFYSGKYDFHHGVDILADKYTNVYAVADGVVRINGSDTAYSNPLVQIKHTDWKEDTLVYTNYIHITMSKENGADPIYLPANQPVSKGQLIAYVLGKSNVDHIQFEVRVGSLYSRDACNPWKYLPNSDNDYTSFQAELSLTPNYNSIDCEAIVNVSVPPDQLTFNRVELHILDNSDNPQKVRFYDMCGANSNITRDIEDRTYLEDPDDSSSYKIIISPKYFRRQSYANNQNAEYGFEFVDLPQLDGGGGKVMAKIFDVFDNSQATEYISYTCTGSGGGGEGTTTSPPPVTRNDRVWPIGNGDSVDLGQSSPYGSRSFYSGKYDFHHGVDILADKYTNVYAVADGVVRINGSHTAYSNPLVQIKHTDWKEDTLVYTNYVHITMSKENGADPIYLPANQPVSKGQLIAYVLGKSNVDHIQFEVRVGSLYSRDACNPWKYLPNSDNDYTSFEAELSLTPNYNSADCEAIVNVSVAPDQLTFNRVELHILDNSDNPQKVRFYDMCGANSNITRDIDDRTYLEDPDDSSSYKIIMSPKYFRRQSYANNQNAEYGFEFVDLPQLDGGGGKVMAKIFDVFDNSQSTEYVSYTCSQQSTTSALVVNENRPDEASGGGTLNFSPFNLLLIAGALLFYLV